MIPLEWIYGLIGIVLPIVAARLGLPIFGPKTPVPDLREVVRNIFLELLKNLNQPQPAPDQELRKLIGNVVSASSEKGTSAN